tara:strand:- start:318 stop:1139 length:822 start_codon:yes stop_codon:yes gene_type:complete
MQDLYQRFYKQLIKSDIDIPLRDQIGHVYAALSRSAEPAIWAEISSSYIQLKPVLSRLQKSGFAHLKLPSTRNLISDLLSLQSNGHGHSGPGNRSETEYLSQVRSLRSVQSVLKDKLLYNLVSLYLGAPAHIYQVLAWWQYPMGENHIPSNAQLWHRDRDDLRFLKLFFYVTDVDTQCGPHAFIPYSHDPTSSKLSDLFTPQYDPILLGSKQSFLNDSDLESIGLLSLKHVYLGPAGTCFLEDTRGFHRAYVPVAKPRLIFSVVWTLSPGFHS